MAIEGIDGCGKDTVAKMFIESFARQQLAAVTFADLTDTAVGKEVRNIFLNTTTAEESRAVPSTEALLITAARNENMARNIEPSLVEGKIVIANRFTESTAIYQGDVKGVSGVAIELERFISTGLTKPVVTVWINTTPEIAAERMKAAGKGDYHESKGIEFHNAVFAGYARRYMQDPVSHLVINGDGSLEDVQADVDNTVAHLLALFARGQWLTPEYIAARKALFTNEKPQSLTEQLVSKVTAPEVIDTTKSTDGLSDESVE